VGVNLPIADRLKANEYARNWRRAQTPEKQEQLKAESRRVCREWYAKNRERVCESTTAWRKANREWDTLNVRLRLYGLTLDQYHSLYERQDFGCAICGDCDKKLVIDHCHQTGRVRGLLCTRCNVGLGIFGESVAQIKKSIGYIEKHQGA
jgi:hypothetical protein